MTTKPAPTKRHTSTSSTPLIKPQCKIHSTATIAEKAQITGPHVVEIGEKAFIHPHAKIKAEFGNVTIGKGCIISEKAVVGLSSSSSDEEISEEDADVVLGEGVSVESGACVEARRVGEFSTVGVNARVGAGAVVGRWCSVAPLEVVRKEEVVGDFVVVFGQGRRRVDAVLRDRAEVRDGRMRARDKEGELLRGLVVDGSGKWTGG